MWSKKLIIILVCIFLYSYKVENNYPPDYCDLQNTSFTSGEKLVFKAYYNWKFVWIPAGEAEFNLKENRYDYEIRVEGSTYESYDNFFRVRDYFYSKIDKQTLYPKCFVRIIEEGNYRKFDSISFDQKSGKAITFVGKNRSTAVRNEVPLDKCTHDLLSVLYFLRNVNVDAYKKGDFIPTSIIFDNEKFPIKVRYDGKEAKKKIKDLGTFNTVKVIPDLVVGNVFKEGDKMKIWVTDDANKLPLLVESPLKVGHAKAVLKSYSGLRNPNTSKLK